MKTHSPGRAPGGPASQASPDGSTSAGRKSLAAIASLAALLLLVLLAIACGGGSTPSPTAHPDPEQALRDLIDGWNRGDYQSFYDGLSADRRQSTSFQEFQDALDTVRALAGRVPQLEIASVTNKVVTGDSATADVTINVKLGSQGIPEPDTASFVWEDGRWHLADHFIETALTTIGAVQGTPPASSSPSPAS